MLPRTRAARCRSLIPTAPERLVSYRGSQQYERVNNIPHSGRKLNMLLAPLRNIPVQAGASAGVLAHLLDSTSD